MEKNTSKQIDIVTAMNNNPVEEVLSKVSTFNDYVIFLWRSIEDLQLENSRLKAELSEQKGFCDRSQELEEKIIELSGKTAECKWFEKKCAILETENKRFEEQLNEAYRDKVAIDSDRKVLQGRYDDLINQKTSIEKDNNEKDKLIDQLSKEKQEFINKNKQIEQDLADTKKKLANEEIAKSELNTKNQDNERKIAGFEESILLFYNGIITSIKKCIDEAKEQVENETLINYLSEININTSESYEKTINNVDDIVLHESSALCHLLTIRMWAGQSDMQKKLFEKYDFTSLIMLTENLVHLTRHFGYEIVALDNPIFQKDLKSSGYTSAQEYAKVTPKLFPEFCDQQEQNIYCEFREISFTKSQGELFSGSLYYVEGTKV